MFSCLISGRITVIIAACVLLVFSGFSTVMAQSDPDWVPRFQPTLQVSRVSGEIKIDGFLNDPGWQGAAVADHFHERDPGYNIAPPVKTKAFMTYDDTHLYLSAICYDDPENLRISLGHRDRMGGDNIGFFFDTYGDAAWAYTINVNAYGVQADGLWSNGYGEDGMFDLVFESAGQVTDSGYQVELAIPFASLRFPDTDEQVWRMQFWRHHYRDVHYCMVWAADNRDESNWVRNWGYIKGIKNVTPGKGIEIIPALTGSQAGLLTVDSLDRLDFDNDDVKGELSLSGKYAVSSNITIDATVNPDFSNIESDAFQIDVNSPTALSYPEKRPFFQEGSDLYRTRMNLVYTRSINDPEVAAKVTARLGRTSISYLGAHDQNSPFVIPFEETSSGQILGGKSFSNIIRARRTFGSGSQVGILLTDRRWKGGGSGTTFSTDAVISFNRQLTLRTQFVGSYTDEPNDPILTSGLESITFDDGKYTAAYDGESFGGFAYSGNLSYQSQNFYTSASYSEYSPTFRADNGWITRNNRRSFSSHTEFIKRFDQGLITLINFQVNPMCVWNTAGETKDEAIFTTLYVPLRFKQMSLSIQHMISTEKFGGVYYDDIWNIYGRISASPSQFISLGSSYNYGNQLAYGYNALGRQERWSAWTDLRPIDRILFEHWITHVKSREVNTDIEMFNGYVMGSRLSFQYDRRLSFRVLAQYNDFSKTWDIDPLVRYQISPFTLFYFGSTYYVQKIDGLNSQGDAFSPDDEKHSFNKLDSRQFFMKLQYLFQI